ncbi:MAG: hypothetical protein O3B72_09710, partial [Proteobacteria bacterium]|nr:hypothetical protein [Pseudomonadota bacterium]
MSRATTHWSRMSAAWKHVGSPLRPSPADQALFNRMIKDRHPAPQEQPLALILGVTAELCFLDWPPGTGLFALDSSPEMIAHVWPGDRSSVVAGAW